MAALILLLPSLVAPSLEFGEAALLTTHDAPVQPQRRARELLQKGAVVADEGVAGAGG